MSDVQESTGAPRVMMSGVALDANSVQQLSELRVDQTVNAPAQATLRFFDEDFLLCDSTTFEVAKEIEVSFPDGNGTLVSVFKGEIVAVAVDQGIDGLPELLITALDRSHRLGRTTAPKTFVRQKYSSLIREMASAVGLRADLTFNDLIEFEYLAQTTDALALLSEMARRTGTQWRVIGDSLTVFQPPKAAASAVVSWGNDLLRFKTRFSGAEWNDRVTVRGWDPKTKRAIVGVDSKPKNQLSTAPLAVNGRKKVAQFGSAKRQTGGTVVTSNDEANRVATAMRGGTSSVEISARGEANGNPAIVAGSMIEVTDVGTRLSGKYYVTEVEHVFNVRGYVTRFTAGSLSPSSLVDLTGGPATNRGSGPVIGIVSNNNDPEGFGRVKVQFPAQGDDIESDWARLATIGGGSGRGLMFMPSINDEVLVMFEQGDLRRPLVIGSVWNGKDKPPFTAAEVQKAGKAHRWGLKTPGGHQLSFFDDSSAHQRMEIQLNDGKTKLVLGRDRVEIVANDTDLELKSGRASVLLKKGNDVEITAQNITLNAQQNVKVSGLKFELAASTTVKLEGSAKLDLVSNGPVKISSAAIVEISGSLVKIN